MTTTLDILRPPTTAVCTIQIDDKAIFTKRLMAEWYITAEYISPTVLTVQLGDYIVWDSENYFINRLPDVEKLNNDTYRYSFVFDSVVSDLNKKLYMWEGLADFSLNGTAEDFINLLITNINSISSGWTKGAVDTTTEVTMQFANESCRAVLVRVAEQFKMEFEVVGKAINLSKTIGTTTALTFTYGRGLGLYNLTRQQVNDQNILTRVYGFGGTRNISADYRSRAKRLVFETGGKRYLEANTDLYGIIEGQFTDDTIYPQRTGTLTAVNIVFDAGESGTDFNPKNSYVEDSTINFDINDYLLKELNAKIVFKTGDLAGIECDIWKYDHASRRIYFNPYSDTDGYTLPKWLDVDSQLKPRLGDSYTLVDMKMPQEYIDNAEIALQAATQTFINENSVPMVVYSCNLDPQYVKTIAVPTVGDKVKIMDTALGIDDSIRISGIEYPLVNPNKITATIADFVPYTLQERIIKETITQKKEVRFVDRRSAELTRRATMRQTQLQGLLFDTDGYFDNTNIKPNSIETLYFSAGAKSSDLLLNGVVIKANYNGNENSIYITTGSLIHNRIEIASLGYVWNISPAYHRDDLVTGLSYYLYAKCSKTALTGEWVLSLARITVEEVAGYYHFLCGILFASVDGYRDYDFTYGMTYIVGNTIKTGTVMSIDGNNYLNLTENKFRVGNTAGTKSFDWNVTSPDTLTLKGALVQSAAGTFPVLVFCGAYAADTIYSKGNQVTYGGSSWNYINATPGSGHTPSEDAYWTSAADRGQSGIDIIMTNVAMPLQASSAGVVSSYSGSGTSFGVYEGGVRLEVDQTEPYANSTFRVAMIAETGITAGAQSTSGTPVVWITYADAYNMTADKASITFIITVKNSSGVESSFTKMQTFAKAKAGIDGSDGISVIFQGSYASVDALIADKGALQNGWSYYNTSYSKSYVYYNPTWYLISQDGGEGNSAYVHIAWATDANGTNFNTSWFSGATYMGIYTDHTITDSGDYHDYAWSKTVGTNGINGERGPAITYRKDYNIYDTYYGTAQRVDVVRYGSAYYSAKPTIGGGFNQLPTNTAYWDSFGASFESIATGLLFTEKAVVENLAVRYYEGVALGEGSLTGSASTVTPYSPATARIDTIDFSGSTGIADVTCENVTREISFSISWSATIDSFISSYYYDYYAANVIISRSGDSLVFTAKTAGVDFTYNDTDSSTVYGDIYGTVNTYYQASAAGTARVDKITLSDGTIGGTANITCNGRTANIVFDNTGATLTDKLTNTVADFVASWAPDFLLSTIYSTLPVVVTASGLDIIFTAQNASANFYNSASFTETTNDYDGGAFINGNDIWENTKNNDTASVTVNRRGYNGGMTKYRNFGVFNGRGRLLMNIFGDASGGYMNVWCSAGFAKDVDILGQLNLHNVPTSNAGLSTGDIYQDGAGADKVLKIK